MELGIYGKIVSINGGSDLENPEKMEYAFTEIESISGSNEVSDMPDGLDPFEIKDISGFKVVKGFEEDFCDCEKVIVERFYGWYSWMDLEVWDPDLLVLEKSIFKTPEGELTVYNARYDGEWEIEMVPDKPISCKTY